MLAVLVVAAAGCASASKEDRATVADGDATSAIEASDRPFSASGDEEALATDESDDGDRGGDGEGAGGGASGGADLEGAVPVDTGRRIISTASLSVEVDDVGAASQRAVATTEAAGGFVYAQTSTFEADPSSTLTLKVPPAEFQATLVTLSELGTALSQEITTDDVTQRAIDLDSRIRTAEASITRLRSYLDRAASVGELAQLEGELVVRETDLETLEAQKRTLEGQTDFATIVATFALDGEIDVEEEDDDSPPGFTDGLDGGLTAATTTGSVALAVVGALLPFTPVFLVVGGVVWWARRRDARRVASLDDRS
jgi:hypothetical protein